jgi:hypothetical protein
VAYGRSVDGRNGDELRLALQAVALATDRNLPPDTDPTFVPGAVVRAAHVTELRAAVRALE